jgi:GxxExxY protein
MYELTEIEKMLCEEIVDSFFKVHKNLGPGLLEKIYELCFCHELSKKNIPFERQVNLPVYYDGLYFDEGLKLDVLVNDLIICEFKAVNTVNEYWTAQLLSHLKLAKKHVGFIVNFNVPLLRDGIRRHCMNF